MGAGGIDVKGPSGNFYAQGQDFTFTLWLGRGVRDKFNPKPSMSLGPAYMHVSNEYGSESNKLDNGINVMLWRDDCILIRCLGKPKENGHPANLPDWSKTTRQWVSKALG